MLDIHDIVSFDEFDFSKYLDHEQTIIKPQLEAKGYTDISFHNGEYDSFGPLSRVVRCSLKDTQHTFVYG